MTVTADALRLLHRLHRQITDVRSRLERGPRLVKAGKVRIKAAGEAHEQARGEVLQAKRASDEKQLQLKSNEDRILDVKRKLNGASSNREYQALVDQIAADEMANSVLSDEILEALERIDALEQEVVTKQEQIEQATEEVAGIQKVADAEQQTLESELARLQGELEEAERILPVDFKKDYQRVVDARGEDALAPLEGETCGSCFQYLTPQDINLIHMRKPIFCKGCGCMLYLPEETSIG